MTDNGGVLHLRDAFARAGYTADGVLERIGVAGSAALARGEIVPALRATRGGDALDTLIRLFLLHRPVPHAAGASALPLAAAQAAGMVAASAGEIAATLDVRPYGSDDAPPEGWWVVSDLGRDFLDAATPVEADHVLGVGGASTTLAQITVRPQVQRALDLGTGCGVQALHLSRHVDAIVATDVLPRALQLARLTAQLCGVPDAQLDLRRGSLFEPVAGERFDLVVSNPPFVVHPNATAAGERFVYRDSGLGGDELGRRLVRAAPHHLAEGGWAQLLANWVHVRGEDWRDRVREWLDPDGGCDVWFVQREVQDIAEYVAMWLRDSGETTSADYAARYDAWLDAFERAGIEAVGFGYIALHRTDRYAREVHVDANEPRIRIEDWPHAVQQPLGPYIEAWGVAQELLRRSDEHLLQLRLVVAPDVRQEQLGLPGAEDPESIVLRQHVGLRRAHRTDTALAAVVGASSGDLPLGALLDAVAQVLGEDASQERARMLPLVRDLIADGLLLAT